MGIKERNQQFKVRQNGVIHENEKHYRFCCNMQKINVGKQMKINHDKLEILRSIQR